MCSAVLEILDKSYSSFFHSSHAVMDVEYGLCQVSFYVRVVTCSFIGILQEFDGKAGHVRTRIWEGR